MAVAPPYKLVGRLNVASVTTIWIQYHEDGSPPGAWVPIDLAAQAAIAGRDGFYVLGDDSTYDLLKWLGDLVSTTLENAGADSDTFTFTLDNATGIVTTAYNDSLGNIAGLAFTDPAAVSDENSLWVRDWLRMDPSAVPANQLFVTSGGSIIGFRAHAFGLYPVKIQLKDNDRFVQRENQALPDTRGPFTLMIAERLEHALGVWLFDSLPRANVWNEYDQFRDLLAFAAHGWPVRYYPDKTLTSPWVETTNAYGYQVWVIDKKSTTWEPRPKVRNFLSRQEHELLLHHAFPTQ